jgi:hypothetical protein
MTLDSVRIACANAESDPAATLAEVMGLPNEAKKLLANLFRAPGHVVAGKSVITLRLAPAANRSSLQSPETHAPGRPAEKGPPLSIPKCVR